MELIRWIKQQIQKIKSSWIQSRIYEGGLMFKNTSKKYEKNKNQLEKRKYYKEPDLRKKKFKRREQMDSFKNC